ncbi:MAG: tetratricopeptide repeat-containing sensor histidine kinase [Candidatus Kapabacteria bacterium]|nr:tetratricopeptide repeat-containing sensor histidine kinase [Candidatus Kapabacteria bacterium]
MIENKKYFFLIVAVFIIILNSVGIAAKRLSSREADSIEVFISKTKQEDTNYVNNLNSLASFYLNKNPDKSLKYFTQSIEVSEKLKFKLGNANALQIKGIYLKYKADFPAALENMLKALKLFEDLNNKKKIASVENSLGTLYFAQQNYPLSIQHLENSLKIATETGDSATMANAISNFGMVYFQEADYKKALGYYLKGVELGKKIGDMNIYSNSLSNCASVYANLKEFNKALDCYKEILEINKKINNKAGTQISLMNLGETYKGLSQKAINDKNPKLANDYNNKALDVLKESFSLANELKMTKEISNVAFCLAGVYHDLGQDKDAFHFSQKAFAIRDSLFTAENQKSVKDLASKYEQEKNEARIKFLELEQKDQIKFNVLLIVLLIVGAVSIISLFFINWLRKNINKKLVEQNISIENLNKDLHEKNILLSDSESKLIGLNNLKDKFFSIMAHDLKNPINSFKIILESLTEQYNDFNENERIYYLKILRDTSNHLLELLDNLLTWSHLRRGTLTFEPDEAFIKMIVDISISIVKKHADEKNISITNNIADDISCFVDIGMCMNILKNLISNAVKFTNNNGNILIFASPHSDDYITITVQDNGIGIDENNLSKLFKMDFDLTLPGTNNESGSGLGLILCNELVQMQKGTISVQSKINEGSSFSVSLPLYKPEKVKILQD